MIVFERLYNFMKKPLASLLVFGVFLVSFFYIDKPLADYFHLNVPEKHVYFWKMLSTLGNNKLYLAGLLILILISSLTIFKKIKNHVVVANDVKQSKIELITYYALNNRTWTFRALFVWLSVLSSSLVCGLLKINLGRARPDKLFSQDLYGFYGFSLNSDFWSFPSGHAATIMSVVFSLSILFPKWSYRFISFGVLIVATRLILTCHYLSDVLVSMYLSLLIVGVLNNYRQRLLNRN